MHDLACPQEFDGIVDIRIIGQPQDIVVGHAGLLLGGKVFGEVGDGVARDLHGGGRPRIAGRKLREYACRMIDKVGIEASFLDLVDREVPRELMDNGADHLKVSQFLCADCGGKRATTAKKPCAARVTGRKR